MRAALAVAALAVAQAAGCGGILVVDERQLGDPPSICVTDGDCAPPAVCANSVCVVRTGPCRNDVDCLADYRCVDGGCVPAPFADDCSATRPFGWCPPGQVCDAGTCITPDPSTVCDAGRPHGDCPPAQRCSMGVCVGVDPNEVCALDRPTGVCPGLHVCVDGTCVFRECGNSIVEPTEACDGAALADTTCADLGFTGGTLFCGACVFDTSGCTTCGDGVRELDEDCEPSLSFVARCWDLEQSPGVPYTSGTLACAPDCRFDTTACTYCGDGVRNDIEDCDGQDTGSASRCTDLGTYDSGALGCTPGCAYDVSGCGVCGDGIRDAGEECDDLALDNRTCADVGLSIGAAHCLPNCTVTYAGCCGNDQVGRGEACDGAALRGLTCAALGLIGGRLTCAADCDTFAVSDCGLDHLELRPLASPSLTTPLVSPPGGSATQQFELWATFNDQTAALVTAAWFSTNAAAGSISDAGLYTTSANLTGNAQTVVIASYGGQTASRAFAIEVANGPAPTCGNGIREGTEECDPPEIPASCQDLGFDDGTVSCLSCAYDVSACTSTTCGNGSLQGAEQCDGGDLGTGTCVNQGFAGGGTLTCNTNCTFNTSQCASQSGNPLADLVQIDFVHSCDPDPASACPVSAGVVQLVYDETGAPSIDIDAIGSFDDGVRQWQQDITSLLAWTIDDAGGDAYNSGLGTLDPLTGIFTPGGAAGTVHVVAATDATQINCPLQGAPPADLCRSYDVQITVNAVFTAQSEPDITLPVPVPQDPETFFAAPCTPTAAKQPVVVYPNDNTLFPRNVYQALFQWLRGCAAAGCTGPYNGLFRARFDNAATGTHVSIFTTADRWRPSANAWQFLTRTNAGGSVDFTVDAIPFTGVEAPGACYESAKFSVRVGFSRADVPGSIYYWSTSIGGIKKASITSANPIDFLYSGAGVGSNYSLTPPVRVPGTPAAECVACHALSRDGRQLAGSFKRDDEMVNYDLSGTVAGVAGQIGFEINPAATDCGLNPRPPLCKAYWPTFSDSGEKLVAYDGNAKKLRLYKATGGATLGANSGVLPTGTVNGWAMPNLPDWSPDGRWLAFIMSAAGARDGDKTGALAVLRYNRESFAGLPGTSDNPWGKAPWTEALPLLLNSTGNAVTGGNSNWHHPTVSPDSLWIVVARVPDGTGVRNDAAGASPALLYAVKWASCEVDGNGACVPYPICAATGVALCGPNGDQVCPVCQPVPLTALNTLYSNCSNPLSPASPCETPPTHQTNMPRWAPTNRPDSYFLVFTSHRPYGKVSGEQLAAGTCAVPNPPAACFSRPTDDQLWVAGFDGARIPDPSHPPFYLPFQVFSEANHRAYWTHDPGSGFTGCTLEICDRLDNDCDGLVDEGCCTVAAEVCDGRDNDCDGIVDERDTPNGPVPGGICCTPTIEVCDGADNNCNGLVDEGCTGCTASQEVCDGFDNDCDGQVDTADSPGQAGTGPGVQYAAGCGTAGCPCCSQEICDGIDNDCDALIDDADPQVQLPAAKTCCYPWATDPCNGVDDDCDGIVDNGCCIPDNPPIEVCDGRDNDCDTLIDEADPDLGPGACCRDADQDGFTTCAGDCADDNPNINPGVSEIDLVDCGLCDNDVDEDCDGADCTCQVSG